MIFPTLKGKRFSYVNLDTFARFWLPMTYDQPMIQNPLLDPQVCQTMVDECHNMLGVAYSYGGWMEDRSTLWRGSYLDRGAMFTHLGLDINAPVGTPVAVDMPGEIVLIDCDHPLVGGWGTRVMYKLDALPIVLIYGHLAAVRHVLGTRLCAGEVLAEIGPSTTNGSWYTHVHVQAMTDEAYAGFLQDPPSLDGYSHERYIPTLVKLFPDPMQFVSIK